MPDNNSTSTNARSGGGLGARFVKTYTTFSGVDITAMFDDKTMLSLSGISVSITREKAPVYTFGSATPRSISRGKRGIAGSFVFTLFDRTAFLDIMQDPAHWYYAHRDEVNWLANPTNATAPPRLTVDEANTGALNYMNLGNYTESDFYKDIENPDWASGNKIEVPIDATNPAGQGTGDDVDTTYAAFLPADRASTNRKGSGATIPPGAIVDGQAVTIVRMPIYADQVFPFDITLVAQNEYGQAAWSSVEGVEIINEGSGVSIDDITNEEQFTYIAIHRETWRPINRSTSEGGVEDLYGSETAFTRTRNGIFASVDGDQANAQFAPFWSRSIEGTYKIDSESTE